MMNLFGVNMNSFGYLEILLTFFLLSGYHGSPINQQQCDYAVDIAFLIDSSDSVRLEYPKELQFVQEIASGFQISDGGTHAGAVVFSDHSNYTRVTIKLNQFSNPYDFNRAIANSPFIGYRTRIDLAFKRVEEELFTIKGGARPNMKKIIFLITDGQQTPRGSNYDPVKASQSLIDKGVKIFAVGVGVSANKTELEQITRYKDRVYFESTFDGILSSDFIKNVSKKLCLGGNLVPITTNTPNITLPPSTTQLPTPSCNTTVKPQCSNGCGSCCTTKDVYINIFARNNTGPVFLMQGVTLTGDSKNSIIGYVPSSTDNNTVPSLTTNQIIDVIKKALPNEKTLVDLITKKLSGSANTIHKRSVSDEEAAQDAQTLEDLLDGNENLSMYKEIWERSEFNELLNKKNSVKELCFSEFLCVSVASELREHLDNVLSLKKFTFLIPDNEAFANKTINREFESKEKINEFLAKHTYIGRTEFSERSSLHVSHNLLEKPAIGLFIEHKGGERMVIDVEDKKYRVKEIIELKNGVAYIIENM